MDETVKLAILAGFGWGCLLIGWEIWKRRAGWKAISLMMGLSGTLLLTLAVRIAFIVE